MASLLLTSITTPSGNLTPFTTPDLSISTLTQLSSLFSLFLLENSLIGLEFSFILFRLFFLELFLFS